MSFPLELILGSQGLLLIAAWLAKRSVTRIEHTLCEHTTKLETQTLATHAQTVEAHKTQLAILTEVRTTNGRVTRVEQQVNDHDRLDDRRFDSLDKTLERIEKKIDRE